MNDGTRLLAHGFVTAAMVGLIWTIQVVHYPLFAKVGVEAFEAYERSHMGRITVVVGPLMLAEMVLALSLLVWRPSGVPMWMLVVGVVLVLGAWVMTATVQGPIHGKMASGGFDAEMHRTLVVSNWARTAMWTARGVLAMWMVKVWAEGLAGAGRGVVDG